MTNRHRKAAMTPVSADTRKKRVLFILNLLTQDSFLGDSL